MNRIEFENLLLLFIIDISIIPLLIIILIITVIFHCLAFFLRRHAKVQPRWSLTSLLFVVTSWLFHLYYQADACPIAHVTEAHYHVRNGARLSSIINVSHYPSRIVTALLIHSEPSVHWVSVTGIMMLHHASICQFIKCVCIGSWLSSRARERRICRRPNNKLWLIASCPHTKDLAVYNIEW